MGRVLNTETGKMLHPRKLKDGYHTLILYGDDGRHYWRLHRLIAEFFCEKRDGCNVINHIDYNPSNNAASNLEWVTQKENIHHSIKNGRMAVNLRNAHEAAKKANAKTAIRIDVSSGERKAYTPIVSAKADGYDPSCIAKCCRGKIKKYKGYRWEYA